jgi:hypothetical protein
LPAVSVQVALFGMDSAYGFSLTAAKIFDNYLDAKTVVATRNGQSIYAMGKINLAATGPAVLVQGLVWRPVPSIVIEDGAVAGSRSEV